MRRSLLSLVITGIALAEGFNIVEFQSGWQSVRISQTDVNRIVCEKGDVKMVVYSQEKEVQVKYDGRNVFVKLVPKIKDGNVVIETYPRELYIDCAGDVFQLILVPQKIPAQTIYLRSPYRQDLRKAKDFEKASSFQDLLSKLIKSVYLEEVPDGYDVEVVNRVVKRFAELDLLLYRKYSGYEFDVYEFIINAKLDLQLFEGAFLPYLDKPIAIAIVKPILKAGESTRMIVVSKAPSSITFQEPKREQQELPKNTQEEYN